MGRMARLRGSFDAVVVGEHPSASLAAALLAARGRRVVHLARRETKPVRRLAWLSPAFFDLDKALAGMRRRLSLTPLRGMTLLGDRPEQRGQFLTRSASAFVVDSGDFAAESNALAKRAGTSVHACQAVRVEAVDDRAVRLFVDGESVSAGLLLLGSELDDDSSRLLGVPARWSASVTRRLTFVRWRDAAKAQSPTTTLVVCMDLAGTMNWAWLLRGRETWQAIVETPAADDPRHGAALLDRWLELLGQHGIVVNGNVGSRNAAAIVLPFEGALERECVANRTLLFGPAGGFVCGSGEELHPCAWSAVFAAACADEALRSEFVQDALRRYRESWGGTLGDYLRAPRNNLRYLLPLALRNAMMTRRLAEAVLFGKSVVR